MFFQYCITVIKDEIARFVYDIHKHPVWNFVSLRLI
jgi:hypothetical protein